MQESVNGDLHLDRVALAQEVRLLRDVLEALGGADNLSDVLRVVGYGIKNILPYSRWQTVSIALTTQEKRQLDVYRVHGKLANAYWGNVGKGAFGTARELGIELSFEAAGVDEGFQARAIDTAIAAGVDGIAIAPIDPHNAEPAIARARAAGIPVVTIDAPPVENSAALLYIGTDNEAAGRIAAAAMQHLVPEGGAVGVMTYYLQALNSRRRIAGFEQQAAAGGLTLLPPFDVQGVDEHGVERAKAMLQANPDLAGAFGVCAMNAPGWASAAHDLGHGGRLKVVGFDLAPDTIEQLKRGEIHAVIAQREAEMGNLCVEILCRMLVEGIEPTLRRYPASRTVDTGVDVISLEGSDWSIGLADYLVSAAGRGVDQALRDLVTRRPKRPRIVVIGMETPSDAGLAVERIAYDAVPLLAEVLSSGRPQINLPQDANEQLTVCVPLVDRHGELLGVLSLESTTLQECFQTEMAQFDRIAKAIALLIENSALITAIDERGRELSEANQRQAFLLDTVRELSSPIVAITSNILVLPLVGSVDTHRAQEFTTTLLETISLQHAKVVLVDITGVTVVDTAVAAGLLNAARSARLLGAEVVFVGISAPVAQTLVGLGIDFGHAKTFANLQAGFAYALRRTGGKIIYDVA